MLTSLNRKIITCSSIYFLLNNQLLPAQNAWQEYEPYSLRLIFEDHVQALKDPSAMNLPSINIMAPRFVYKIAVPYSDSLRAISSEKKQLLEYCFKAKNFDESAIQAFDDELFVREDSISVWIPIQRVLIPDLKNEARKGETIILYLNLLGASTNNEEIQWLLIANEFKSLTRDVRNQFRFLGIVDCITDESYDEWGYSPCLSFGSISLGDRLKAIESKFGTPYQIVPISNKSESRIYPLTSQSSDMPYLVVTYEDSVATEFQLTGDSTTDDLRFSSIELGDSEKKIIEILGEPSSKSEVQEVHSTLWSYSALPFSIEVKNGRVYSIKIFRLPPRYKMH
jgi:hypothetical protein